MDSLTCALREYFDTKDPTSLFKWINNNPPNTVGLFLNVEDREIAAVDAVWGLHLVLSEAVLYHVILHMKSNYLFSLVTRRLPTTERCLLALGEKMRKYQATPLHDMLYSFSVSLFNIKEGLRPYLPNDPLGIVIQYAGYHI